MGILKDSMNGNTPDVENDPKKREEDYEKLFMKISRDFVHKGDLQQMFGLLLEVLGAYNPNLSRELARMGLGSVPSNSALQKGQLYKYAIDNNLDIVKQFAKDDIINMDED